MPCLICRDERDTNPKDFSMAFMAFMAFSVAQRKTILALELACRVNGRCDPNGWIATQFRGSWENRFCRQLDRF